MSPLLGFGEAFYMPFKYFFTLGIGRECCAFIALMVMNAIQVDRSEVKTKP
jgi:hypothetical protein